MNRHELATTSMHQIGGAEATPRGRLSLQQECYPAFWRA